MQWLHTVFTKMEDHMYMYTVKIDQQQQVCSVFKPATVNNTWQNYRPRIELGVLKIAFSSPF